MPPRVPLGAFLARARSALTAPASQRASPLTLVVGNESADLDSLCSAVVYAYLRTHAPPHTLHVPVSNLARDDLKLRTEMTAALAHARLAPEDLLTLDDLPADLAPRDTRWVLVDHNALTGDLAARFAGRVVGCVDHHADEGAVPRDTGDEPRVVETCGSCSSLVVEHCRPAWEEALADADARDDADVDAHLAQLSLAAILIDTTNLKSKDKTTDKDVAAVSFLERLAPAPYSRDALFDEISAVKEDISSLSFRDVFRKDYKQWEDQSADGGGGRQLMGTSAVVQNLGYLVDKAGGDEQAMLREFRRWAEEKALDIGVIMTTAHPGGKLEREVLVWAFNEPAVASCKAFYERCKGELGLAPWRGGRLDDEAREGEWRAAWTQANVAASRKQVAPMLREAIRGGARL
ncbi:exopolyphosphatase [Colletotrichum graminicola M1.001]|uniref:Exopolyphosphatase n=1 Tax=Colletotrichum graminicola (strain M1.001 / M2 / FGSC 10212) TaxID=645133 RepID=E3QMB7_COLGM|nr:exopolyphosphatase [Colletotrichum graminicola M1.001]EFQ32005.1 exopolyphosphatase [Colletotrichum graminicola M1.001]